MLRPDDKPDFVVDGHLSGMRLATHLVASYQLPTQKIHAPTCSCTGEGLPRPDVTAG